MSEHCPRAANWHLSAREISQHNGGARVLNRVNAKCLSRFNELIAEADPLSLHARWR